MIGFHGRAQQAGIGMAKGAAAVVVSMLALGLSGSSGCSDTFDSGETAPAEEPVAAVQQAAGGTTCVTLRRGSGKAYDAMISSEKAANNYGSSTVDLAGQASASGSDVFYALFKFDLSAIPLGAQITSANLAFSQTNNGAAQWNAHLVSAPWDEATVTWQSFGNAFNPASFKTVSNATASVVFSVTPQLQAWVNGTAPNHGILIEQPGVSQSKIKSQEWLVEGQRPTLSVCYKVVCPPGFADCNGVPADGCEADLHALASCGGCGVTCATPHATPTCGSGSCAIASCDLGWGDCDADPANGCETSLSTTANCGGCGVACDLPGASATCAAGVCKIQSCQPGFSDCDGDASDGCEPLPCADGAHCTSGADCASGVCQDGFCITPACSDHLKNGSETGVDCGGGSCPPCADGVHCVVGSDCASGSCQGGVCQAPSCDDGVKNGDETSVDCGGSCAVPEVCNGVDDDCNGQIDEGLGTTTCGLGACQVTVPSCVNGQVPACVPGAASAEICDGIDNDCDGQVDEPGAAGAVAYWAAEGNAQDAIGGNDGALLNGTGFSAGKIGQAFHFDGIDDHVDVNATAGNFGTGDFSVELWLRTTANRGEGVIGKRASCTHSNFWDLRIESGKLQVELDHGGSNYVIFLAQKAINDGLYHHVALVRQGTLVSLYLDGMLDKSLSSAGLTDVSNPGTLVLGTSACTGSADGTHVFTGDLDEVLLFNRALSAGEIAVGATNGTSLSGCECQNGQTEPCYDGPAGTQDAGACHAGTRSCSFGHWGACMGEVLPSAEVCDGADNDCDGQLDEGLGTVTCGVGPCARTVPACENGAPAACTPQPDGTACNDGHACTTADACVSGVCQGALAAAGTECRASTGPCDPAEACTGSSADCPADAKAAAGTVCRASAGACDPAETCTGASAACPADAIFAAGVVCRASAGACDPAESCDGQTAACPADTLTAAGTVCRASAGACDPAETCTGASPACPGNALTAAGTICRASTGVCDPAEACTGASAACPADALSASGTVCRASTGACDPQETCSGASAACPADALSPSGTVCRASAGACDPAEACTGASAACPADTISPSGTICRASGGVCDPQETCTGASAACPADTKTAAGTVCRASGGVCDVAETCDGSSSACPADAFQAASVVCRASAGTCDVAERCTGVSAGCPADAFAASGTTVGACSTGLSGVCSAGTNTCSGASASPSCVQNTPSSAEVCDGLDNNCNGTVDDGVSFSGAIASWHANGNALDAMGTYNGTLGGGTSYVAGEVGQAFSFNGSNSRVDFGTTIGNFGTNNFTIELWMKTSSSRGEGIFGKRPTCAHTNMIDLRLGGGKLNLEIDQSGSNYLAMGSNKSVNDGVWHHVAIVRSGVTVTFYIDGAFDKSGSTGGVTNLSSAATFTMGLSTCTGADGTSWFTGQLDEFTIYNRALSAAEVGQIYTDGSLGKCSTP